MTSTHPLGILEFVVFFFETTLHSSKEFLMGTISFLFKRGQRESKGTGILNGNILNFMSDVYFIQFLWNIPV
jgi:hypothetical protein